MNYDKIMNVLFFILAMLCFLALGLATGGWIQDAQDNPRISKLDIETNCTNLSVIDTSTCLVEQIAPHYYYNMSNLNYSLTDAQLLSQGGVCWHYAKWYANQAEMRGFNATTVSFFFGSIPHRVAVVSDETHYCVIDQTRARCF